MPSPMNCVTHDGLFVWMLQRHSWLRWIATAGVRPASFRVRLSMDYTIRIGSTGCPRIEGPIGVPELKDPPKKVTVYHIK